MLTAKARPCGALSSDIGKLISANMSIIEKDNRVSVASRCMEARPQLEMFIHIANYGCDTRGCMKLLGYPPTLPSMQHPSYYFTTQLLYKQGYKQSILP